MAVFWISVVVLVGASFAFLLPYLLGKGKKTDIGYRQSIIGVQRDRRAEFERMLADGELDKEAYDEACRELESELIDELQFDTESGDGISKINAVPAVAIAVLLPVAAITLYLLLGAPDALNEAAGMRQSMATAEGSAGDQIPHSVEEMVARLAERLQGNPEDPDGWVILGRSYAAMNRFPAAREALLQAYQRRPEDPNTLVALAEVEAALNGNNLAGEPTRLLQSALDIDPDFVRGLWLAGVAAFNRGDADAAVGHWQRILNNPGISESDALQIRQAIARAEQAPSAEAQITVKEREDDSKPIPKALTVEIALAPELEKLVSSEDTLFVFARAAEGPRMPLAIVRKTAGELPMTVKLDDSMAMAPQMRLSSFSSVIVSARISKSGNATPQPGDLSGSSSAVSPSQQAVVGVVIDQVVK